MEFFNRQRRQATLKDWSPKRNNEQEKRVLIHFAIALSGNITGIPDFVTEAFKAIETKDNPIETISLESEIEGVTLDFFDTPEANQKCFMLTAATLRKFTLTRKDDQTILSFNTTVPRPKNIYAWLDKYEGYDLFIAFDATQAKLVFVEGEDDPNQTKLFNKEGEGAEEETINRARKNLGVRQPAGKAAKGKK